MKIVIIEGTDNMGKDTIISNIIQLFPISTVIHCSKPKTDDYNKAVREQDVSYNKIIFDIISGKYKSDIIVFNRSFIGEYVYGVLYRNRDKDNARDMIYRMFSTLNMYFDEDDLIYIQLMSGDSTLISKNEDGKSLSNGDIEYIETELNMFQEAFDFSPVINKHIVYINDGDKFRNLNDILTEIKGYIQ